MAVFFLLLGRLIPLYLLVVLGFIATRVLHARKETIASLLIYFITPTVVFTGIANATLAPSDLLIPVVLFAIGTAICLILFRSSKRWLPSPARNIVAFACGNANSGYFGLPVTVALFGEGYVPLAIMASFGFIFFENTVGFYVTARGHFSPRESILRVLKLPALYAFVGGLLLNLTKVGCPHLLLDLATPMRGAYTVLGMMLIGMAVADVTEFRLNLRFLGTTLVGKFLVWPLLMSAILFVTQTELKLFNSSTSQVLLLFSVLPLAANTVAYATLLRAEPNQAALSVLLSTLLALFLIPIFATLFLQF